MMQLFHKITTILLISTITTRSWCSEQESALEQARSNHKAALRVRDTASATQEKARAAEILATGLEAQLIAGHLVSASTIATGQAEDLVAETQKTLDEKEQTEAKIAMLTKKKEEIEMHMKALREIFGTD